MDAAAKIATLMFIRYIKTIPKTPVVIASNNAVFILILFLGSGRFLVLVINLSKSLSMIWLKILDELTIRIPPVKRYVKSIKLIDSEPKK